MTDFVKRKIDVTFRMGEGETGEKPGPIIKISGLRVATRTEYYNAAIQAECQIRIYGLKQSLMNYLSGTGYGGTEIRRNTVIVEAGNEGGVISTVYQGEIRYSYADYAGAPEVYLNVQCYAALVAATKPEESVSYKGATDVATIMQGLAKKMVLAFENDGVNVKLTDQHLKGTALDQVKQCAQAANIDYSIEFGKLVIFPKGQARKKVTPVVISKETGMVGYPATSSQGLSIVTVFNPSLVVGGRIEIRSDITTAQGEWVIAGINHVLESELPNGAWFSQIMCRRPPQE